MGAFFSAPDRLVEPVSVEFGTGSKSRAQRRRSQSVNRGKDGAHHRAGDGDLGQLDGDGPGMARDAGPDLDQPELKAGQ